MAQIMGDSDNDEKDAQHLGDMQVQAKPFQQRLPLKSIAQEKDEVES